ncbi:MAG: gluconate 2-dehydrogenase subunit 3 family protein, partial [Bacteroidota bacterium]
MMNRRETFKTLLVGVVAGSTIAGTTSSCEAPEVENKTTNTDSPQEGLYGRTPMELEHDAKIMAEVYLTETELSTIAVLCDIILPATPTAGSANDAEVPAFIDFIVKDIPSHQLPLRGGLMWLNTESNRRFNKEFTTCNEEEQIAIIDDIAFPDPDGKKPEMAHGIRFFALMRNLTLTGYYTTRMGIDDLGYVGNY